MKKTIQHTGSVFAASMLAILILAGSALSAKTTVIKFATLAPKGTAWAKYIRKMTREIEKKSNNTIKFKLYLGGVAGDEKTVVRKMRSGAIDVASLTGIGLGEIAPAVRLMELPMFFKNTRQVDRTVKALYPDFQKIFDKKGFALIGWGEAGFVYLMSKKPGKTSQDLKGMKVWMPTGDPLVKAMLKEYGLVPVPLGIESVLTQLQTGGLDAVYGPPMGAIGLQWFREVKYMLDFKLANAIAATVMSKKSMDKLSADQKKVIQEVVEKWSEKFIKAIRRENARGYKVLMKRGIKVIKMPAAEKKIFAQNALRVQKKLTGKLYPAWLLKKAIAARGN